VKGPFQVVSDVHTEELQAFDPLHCDPINVDGGVLSLLSPVVHNQRFVKGEVIFLVPLRQGYHFLPVGGLVSSLLVIRPTTVVVSKLDD
jgi:hypothetical protein